jgi:hypothetical protein
VFSESLDDFFRISPDSILNLKVHTVNGMFR